MESGSQTGVIIDGRPGFDGDRGEQVRLRRLGHGQRDQGKFEITALASPGTFPVSVVVTRDELDALLLDYARIRDTEGEE